MKVYPEIVSLSNEDVASYPYNSFNGQITVVSNQRAVDEAVAYLSQCSVIGFDTETRPTFTKNHKNTVALLQLSDEKRAFLFRLKLIGLPTSLVQILTNESIRKVGVAVHDDIKALQEIKRFTPKNFIDLQTIAKQLHIEAMGLRTLTPLVLGFKISKRQQLSNWENIFLSRAQRQYAATDAWVSLQIFLKLQPYTTI
ncbi:MAG: 3'-5' exonuclease domain-containing protein 2 [Bacteroidales bacterium]|nr:3'-5' exonuclease domain-containing protein 2 [Bacteroidales bacterium]